MRRIGQGNLGDLALLSPNDMVELHGTMNLNYAVGLSGLTFTSDPTDPAILDGQGAITNAFRYNGGDGLNLLGLTVQNYFPGQQRGAVQGASGDNKTLSKNWLIEDCDISRQVGIGNGGNNGGGYGLRTGDGMIVRRTHLNDNPNLGFGGAGLNVLMEDVELARNNWQGSPTNEEIEASLIARAPLPTTSNSFWEGGGNKTAQSTGFRAHRVHAHHNGGVGFWLDISNSGALVTDLTSEWNKDSGYSSELGDAAELAFATLRYNGLGDLRGWVWGAQLVLQNVQGNLAHHILAVVHPNGGHGIIQVHQNRGWDAAQNAVRFSAIVYEGTAGNHGWVDDVAGNVEVPLIWERVDADPTHATSKPLIPGGPGPMLSEVGARSLPNFTRPVPPPIVIPPEPTDEWEAHVAAADDRLAEGIAALEAAQTELVIARLKMDDLHLLAITPVAPPPFDAVNATDAELVTEGNRLDALTDAVRAEKDARIAT